MSADDHRRHTFQVVCAPGLEEMTALEVERLGGSHTKSSPGSVAFEGNLDLGYSATLWLRTAERVMLRIGRFKARHAGRLKASLVSLPWEAFVHSVADIEARATVRASRLTSRDLVERLVHEAVGDRLAARALPLARAAGASRSAIRQRIQVHLVRDCATVSIDLSGERLDRRGYRLETGPAPLREHVAAALLQRLDWEPALPIVDAMCGSGTFVIEAALRSRELPPSLERRHAFEEWPGFDRARWAHSVDETRRRVRSTRRALIIGADRNAGALGVARRNAARAAVATDITWVRTAFADLRAELGDDAASGGVLIMNPPYGKRLRSTERLASLADLGTVIQRDWRGWRVGVVVPSGAEEALNLAAADSGTEFRHGGLRCRLVCARPG